MFSFLLLWNFFENFTILGTAIGRFSDRVRDLGDGVLKDLDDGVLEGFSESLNDGVCFSSRSSSVILFGIALSSGCLGSSSNV